MGGAQGFLAEGLGLGRVVGFIFQKLVVPEPKVAKVPSRREGFPFVCCYPGFLEIRGFRV